MSKERSFWQYFIREEETIFQFETKQEKVFDELAEELAKLHPDLTFEFGPVVDGRRDFVISAAGIREAFPAVERLYDAKPELKRFRVIKFRPKREAVNDIDFGGLTVRSKDVYYRLYEDDRDVNKVGIRLFLPGYSKSQETQFRNIGYLMLDEAIGEYAVEMHVGFIEMMGHDSAYFEGALPIAELGNDYAEVIARKMH
jgi:hypothetical protein